MDFAAADFSLHQINAAAQSATHSQVVAGGDFPQQHPLSVAEQNNGSSSHIFVVPLHIMRTSTPAIVVLSNTQQVVSLKLTNINYLYW
jgi:hypothetical protein